MPEILAHQQTASGTHLLSPSITNLHLVGKHQCQGNFNLVAVHGLPRQTIVPSTEVQADTLPSAGLSPNGLRDSRFYKQI